MITILFVCYENICRSPMAEGIFTALLEQYHLQEYFSVSSAGTVSYQQGSSPDERAIEALSRSGIDISSLRARCIDDLDLSAYEWIFAMDHENHEELGRCIISSERPRVHRVMEFVAGRTSEEIADPYYGSFSGFEQVAEDLQLASEEILQMMLVHYPWLAEHSGRE